VSTNRDRIFCIMDRPKRSQSDQLAMDTLHAFEQELNNWWIEHESEEEKHRYEAYANYLNTKYLCARLDPLPKSPVVTTITKKVAKSLEDLSKGKKFKLKSQPNRQQPPLLKAASERKQRENSMSSTSTSSSTLIPKPSTSISVVSNKSTGKRHWCTIKDGDWNCSICGKLNYEEDEKCITCGRIKKEKEKMKTEKEKEEEFNEKLKLDLKNNKSLYSKAEKSKNVEMEKIQNDYKSFIQTKLRLDKCLPFPPLICIIIYLQSDCFFFCLNIYLSFLFDTLFKICSF